MSKKSDKLQAAATAAASRSLATSVERIPSLPGQVYQTSEGVNHIAFTSAIDLTYLKELHVPKSKASPITTSVTVAATPETELELVVDGVRLRVRSVRCEVALAVMGSAPTPESESVAEPVAEPAATPRKRTRK